MYRMNQYWNEKTAVGLFTFIGRIAMNMGRLVSVLLASSALYLGAAASADAAILWDPASSNYNGTPFAAAPAPAPAGVGMTTTGVTAYGASFSSPDGNGTVFGFINAIPVAMILPTLTQTDLSSTVLSAGTSVVLEFTKDQSDRVNYIAVIGDAEEVSYEVMSSTRFRVHGKVVNPVSSASGDAGAVFGMYIDTQADDAMDYSSTVFLTDMHFLDITAPQGPVTGTAGISANGINGVEAHFYAFMPPAVLSKFGISDATQCQGYVDGEQVPAGFQNYGTFTNLGFDFDGDSGTQDSVLKVGITRSEWSKHDIQFGIKQAGSPTPTPVPVDTTPPVLSIKGGSKQTARTANLKVKGTVQDAESGTSWVKYTTGSKSKDSGYKKARLRGESWSFTLSGLKKGKTKTAYIKAADSSGNVSAPKTLKVKRK